MVRNTLIKIIEDVVDDDSIVIDGSTVLTGKASILDSLETVNLYIQLEKLAKKWNKTFTWRSPNELAVVNTHLKSLDALVDYFDNSKN